MAESSLELKYHAQAFQILGLEPVISAEALRAIEECERACGVRLPAAMREWYSLQDVEKALTEYTGKCGPASLEYVLEQFAEASVSSEEDEIPRIYVYHDWREGEWEPKLLLDGSDDPCAEIAGEEPIPFTTFIQSMAWWRVTFNGQPGTLYGTVGKAAATFGPPHLDFMREHFEELPATPPPWFRCPLPGKSSEPLTFRFFRPGWFFEVTCDGDPVTGFRRAVYSLTALTGEQLQALDEFAWPCRDRREG